MVAGTPLLGQDRQTSPPPSPLAPELRRYPPELLVTVGLGWGIQQGTFRGSCSQDLTNGRSFGWLAGISYSAPLTATWLWGVSSLLSDTRLQASYRERELLTLVRPGETLTAPVEMRNRTELTVTTLLLWGYLRWRPTLWLVLSAGPAAGIPLGNRFHHEKEPLQQSITLPTGETFTLSGTGAFPVETGTLPTRVSWSGLVHAGSDIVVAPSWWMSFGVYFLVPISAVLQSPATLRLVHSYLTVSLGKSW